MSTVHQRLGEVPTWGNNQNIVKFRKLSLSIIALRKKLLNQKHSLNNDLAAGKPDVVTDDVDLGLSLLSVEQPHTAGVVIGARTEAS